MWPATAPPPQRSCAEAIFKEGYRNLTAGADAMALARGIRKAVDAAVGSLKKQSRPIDATRKDDIANVASISANNDRAIGEIMADAFMKVGKDGVITVERGQEPGDLRGRGRGDAV